MRFSIITATKNNKEGLVRAIDCVRNQSYKDVEHIVVDGGSRDGSVEAIKNEQLKIRNLIYISEPDEGIYDAINKGIKLATGDVIGLLHSDDLFAEPEVLQRVGEAFEQSDADAVYGDLVYIKKRQGVRSQKSEVQSPKSEVNRQKEEARSQELEAGIEKTTNYSTIRYWKTQEKEFTTESERHSALKNGWMPPHPTLFVKRKIYSDYGLFNTKFEIAADYDLILRLLWDKKISTYYINKVLVWMTIGGASNKSLKNIIQKSKEDYLAMKINGINFPVYTLISKNLRKLPQFVARDLS